MVLRGWPAVVLLALGAFFVLFYTWPLKYIGLGELAVIIVWGPLMIGGGYYVITGQWDWNVVLASLPYALGPTTVIFGKHIDKHDPDKAKGIHTLPVIIGERAARGRGERHVHCLQYVLVIYLVITGFFTPGHAARAAGRGESAAGVAHVQPALPERATGRLPGRGVADLLRGNLVLPQPHVRLDLHRRAADRLDSEGHPGDVGPADRARQWSSANNIRGSLDGPPPDAISGGLPRTAVEARSRGG